MFIFAKITANKARYFNSFEGVWQTKPCLIDDEEVLHVVGVGDKNTFVFDVARGKWTQFDRDAVEARSEANELQERVRDLKALQEKIVEQEKIANSAPLADVKLPVPKLYSVIREDGFTFESPSSDSDIFTATDIEDFGLVSIFERRGIIVEYPSLKPISAEELQNTFKAHIAATSSKLAGKLEYLTVKKEELAQTIADIDQSIKALKETLNSVAAPKGRGAKGAGRAKK